MADLTLNDINAQFDDLQAAVVKEETDVQAFIDFLKAKPGGPTPADWQALSDKIGGVKSMVTTFDINNTTPPVTSPSLAAKMK